MLRFYKKIIQIEIFFFINVSYQFCWEGEENKKPTEKLRDQHINNIGLLTL